MADTNIKWNGIPIDSIERDSLSLNRINENGTIMEMVDTINANFLNIAKHGGGPAGIDGTDGSNGVDGANVEYIYALCDEMKPGVQYPTDADKIAGFTAGGDDYLVKPFSYAELLSRVKALIRRYYAYNQNASGKEAEENHQIRIKDLVIDKDKSSVYVKGKEVLFTDTEYQILCLLAENRKKVFSVQTIYETVWNETYYTASNNTVTVHIRNIRKKIEEDVQKPEYVKTVWGRGYRIE